MRRKAMRIHLCLPSLFGLLSEQIVDCWFDLNWGCWVKASVWPPESLRIQNLVHSWISTPRVSGDLREWSFHFRLLLMVVNSSRLPTAEYFLAAREICWCLLSDTCRLWVAVLYLRWLNHIQTGTKGRHLAVNLQMQSYSDPKSYSKPRPPLLSWERICSFEAWP